PCSVTWALRERGNPLPRLISDSEDEAAVSASSASRWGSGKAPACGEGAAGGVGVGGLTGWGAALQAAATSRTPRTRNRRDRARRDINASSGEGARRGIVSTFARGR